jgi:c-di-GMP-binding flagellar brake protein YcgR
MYEAKDVLLPGGYENCRRKTLRVPYIASVAVKTVHSDVVNGSLRDISLTGMFVKIEEMMLYPWQQRGDMAEVSLSITQGKSRLTISVQGKVVRRDADGLAITFSDRLKWWPIFIIFPMSDHFLFDIVTEI